jgi:hypothetical protein
MLPEMKADASRYPNLLFLDASKRDMNILGWPYIGSCIKDNKNKVRVIAECLCIAESIENYAWVLDTMTKMCPSFYLSKIKIVFADQLLNTFETVLVQRTWRRSWFRGLGNVVRSLLLLDSFGGLGGKECFRKKYWN